MLIGMTKKRTIAPGIPFSPGEPASPCWQIQRGKNELVLETNNIWFNLWWDSCCGCMEKWHYIPLSYLGASRSSVSLSSIQTAETLRTKSINQQHQVSHHPLHQVKMVIFAAKLSSKLTLCPLMPGSPGVPGNPRAPCRRKTRDMSITMFKNNTQMPHVW